MTNLKTTLSGLAAALLPWAKQIWPDLAVLFDAGATFALVLFAYFAVDAKKTG